ncbi:MAG TPA: zf-HC2 domain-containing protein [Blastocatellia bacterium]|nr:zf-HC2 domain-containing protein [Blastocatellia bacterium]
MRCWRVDLRRKTSRYLNGELEPREVERIENHLLDCGDCRVRLTRLREGHRLAGCLPRETPQHDSWLAIEAAAEAQRAVPPELNARERPSRWRRSLTLPGLATAAVIIALVLLGAALLLSRESEGHRGTELLADGFEDLDFHQVSIAEIAHNTEPHVVAEGYVSEVRIDHDDGDLVFKLVEDVRQTHPFIVCEILNPKKLAPPRVGSRVRVYGVSRYDNQENHNWYEVHPVLNIEVVR